MIKINLSPDKREFKVAGVTVDYGRIPIAQFIAFGIAGIIPYIIVTSFYIPQKSKELDENLTKITKVHSDLSSERGKIRKSSEELEKLIESEDELKKKLQVLENLTSNRRSPLAYLKQLANLIPSEVWLEKLSLQGNQILIEGKSSVLGDINNFFKTLDGVGFFENVVLKDISSTEEESTFKIQMQVKQNAGQVI